MPFLRRYLRHEDSHPRGWAGRRTPAENSASENFDITLVDTNGDRLRELRDRLDIQTIEGMASRPDVLRAAGAQDAACWWP